MSEGPTRQTEHSPPGEKRALVVPGDIRTDEDGRIVWWRPGAAEVLNKMGWAWVWVLLPLVLAAGTAVVWPWVGPLLFLWGLKLWILLVGAGVAMVVRGIQLAAKTRREPFCVHCGYSLLGLPDHHRCPECGRPYSFELIDEYRKDPAWFVERWKIAHGKQDEPTVFLARPTKRRSRDGT